MTRADRLALRRSIYRGVAAEIKDYLVSTDRNHVLDEWDDNGPGAQSWRGPEVARECRRVLREVRAWCREMEEKDVPTEEDA